MTQKWLIVDPSTPEEEVVSKVEAEGCVGWITGIPPVLSGIAQAEGWTLPYVWEETIS